jgi:hypothetical protein
MQDNWESDLIAALSTSNEEAIDRLEKENGRLIRKLKRVADILASHNIIHNTPLAKQQWIDAE